MICEDVADKMHKTIRERKKTNRIPTPLIVIDQVEDKKGLRLFIVRSCSQPGLQSRPVTKHNPIGASI